MKHRHTQTEHDIVSGDQRVAREVILAVREKDLVHIECGAVVAVDSISGGDWARVRYGNETVKVFVVDLLQRTDPHA